MIRLLRIVLLMPIVALAIVFDWLSGLMHKAADRVAPPDADTSDRYC